AMSTTHHMAPPCQMMLVREPAMGGSAKQACAKRRFIFLKSILPSANYPGPPASDTGTPEVLPPLYAIGMIGVPRRRWSRSLGCKCAQFITKFLCMLCQHSLVGHLPGMRTKCDALIAWKHVEVQVEDGLA